MWQKYLDNPKSIPQSWLEFFDGLNEDQEVGTYFQQAFPELDKAAEDLMNLSIYNPPKSMNLNRYSHS